MTARRVLAIAWWLFVFGAPAYAADWQDVVTASSKSIVRLAISDGDQAGHCSGVVIDVERGLVITAGHCAPAGDQISLAVDGRGAKVLVVNRVLDLAILKTKLARESTALLLATSPPAAGASVAALGYPLNAESVTVQIGVTANPKGMDPHTSDVNLDLLPGDSGGALIDATGHLVGILTGYHVAGVAHLATAVDLPTVRNFIEDAQ